MYTKKCPICKLNQTYNSKASLNRSIKNNSDCKKCSSQSRAIRNSNLSVLLDDTILNYYWLGFIFADGHIQDNNRLKVCLSIIDIEHIIKLKNYLSIDNFSENTNNHIAISAMNSVIIPQLCLKFNIHQNKTINPCDISSIKGNQLTSFIIGFIDGDGCISKQTNREDYILSVKCHSAWLDNLNYITNHLTNINKAYITNAGYARFGLGQKYLIQLKQFGKLNKLPLMERKWDKIKI